MSKQPHTQLSQIVTQAVQSIQAGLGLEGLSLKQGAKVPELRLKDAKNTKPQSYPLLGDRYLVGRSSRSCDIVVRNPVVSQIHCSVHRQKKNSRSFVIKDENSTNGIYYGKRRLNSLALRHGDTVTLGPPELAASVELHYYNPPPPWILGMRYFLYGSGGILGLLLVLIGIEWAKTPVRPLPVGETGPVAIYSRDRTLLNPNRSEPHRELDKLADFSEYLPDAVIASEDSRYYWHFGFDPIGIVRAIAVNLQGGEIREGGSTITQQLARSLFPEVGRQNTLGRKLREIAVASKLEAYYSKDRLLKTYLNRVYLGVGNYGFDDAARFYFDKSATNLTLSEAATLVAILPAPNSYNPVQDYDTALKLRNRVINRMVRLGMVSEAEAARARRSRIEVSPDAKRILANAIAPYFYSYVFSELQALLGQELAQEGNFIVETSLDLAMQQQAETSVRQAVAAGSSNITQGAIVTLNSRTGEILALTGGVDYAQSQFNRATQAQRQPGSTFKVFAYAAALEQGISPNKTYSCAAFTWRGQRYKPCERSGGSIDMYRGLAQSENAVALRVGRDAGLNRVVEVARRLGINSPLDPVPGLIIGQSEVNLLEMTGAYAAFANEGKWNRPHAITRVLDSSDCSNDEDLQTCRVIYAYAEDANTNQQAISSEVAQTMTRLLEGVVRRGTGRRAVVEQNAAGKTGTTDRAVDLWFIGYISDPNLVTGVWLGNDDNSPTQGSSSQAAALWGNYMQKVIQ